MISAEELNNHLNDNSFELIDVRSTEEHDAFDIGGKHIPIAELENSIQEISRDKPIVFYCGVGKRSAEAVKIFFNYFADAIAFSLDGGIKAWKEKLADAEVH
ncbi:MAG TPA: rhodanese-like domain-containing protein [Chitinophagales bacterium]|nr:rhodanese-like domain-containing protein [Chitinophagales bacterium]